jgi:hypothetical protein
MSAENVMKLKATIPKKGRPGRPRLFADRTLTVAERGRRHRAHLREQRAQAALLAPSPGRAEGPGNADSDARVLLAQVDRIEVMLRGLRRDLEHGPMILKRLTELERLVRGDPGLVKAPHHSRRRPLGVDS